MGVGNDVSVFVGVRVNVAFVFVNVGVVVTNVSGVFFNVGVVVTNMSGVFVDVRVLTGVVVNVASVSVSSVFVVLPP